jgi:hypothetical protein
MENISGIFNQSEHAISFVMMATGVICFIVLCRRPFGSRDTESDLIAEARSPFEESREANHR